MDLDAGLDRVHKIKSLIFENELPAPTSLRSHERASIFPSARSRRRRERAWLVNKARDSFFQGKKMSFTGKKEQITGNNAQAVCGSRRGHHCRLKHHVGRNAPRGRFKAEGLVLQPTDDSYEFLAAGLTAVLYSASIRDRLRVPPKLRRLSRRMAPLGSPLRFPRWVGSNSACRETRGRVCGAKYGPSAAGKIDRLIAGRKKRCESLMRFLRQCARRGSVRWAPNNDSSPSGKAGGGQQRWCFVQTTTAT